MNTPPRAFERAAPWLCGGAVILAVLVNMSRDFPLVGHDFAWCIPRLLDTDLHLRINGLTVQWYTPSFGGGLPAFANPQHFEYSLLQAMLYLTSPWVAVLLTTAIVSAIGYAACVALLSGTLGLAPIPSALGGVFFIGNGFYIEHLIAGHVNYQLFPLGACFLYVLLNGALAPLTRGCIAALCVALVIHQGSPLLLILTAGSIVLAAQVIYLIDRSRADWRGGFWACAIGAPLSVALVASKVFAVQSLMRQFPRAVTDNYPVGALHGLAGLGAQLVGGMTIIPALLLAGRPPQQVDGALVRMTGAPWRVWELDTGLSPVLLIVLVIGAVQLARSIRRREMPRLPPGAPLVLMALGLSCWIAVEATLAKGFIYPALRTLPILRSLHVNTRFAVVFILPLTIAGAALLHRWYGTRRPRWQVAALVCLTLAPPWIYLVLPAKTHIRMFDMTPALEDHARAKNGERFPISGSPTSTTSIRLRPGRAARVRTKRCLAIFWRSSSRTSTSAASTTNATAA